MTPCEKLGYKVGDRFEVINIDNGLDVGTVVELVKDDGTVCPTFIVVSSIGTEREITRWLNVTSEDGDCIVNIDVRPVSQRATKPISKSKRQLAQLLIKAGVTQFPEGAESAAQCRVDGAISFYGDKPYRDGDCWWGEHLDRNDVSVDVLIPNWHQTVLSRDEFDQIVAETVVQDEPQPVPTAAPTLDQLLHDWCNADDYAQRKQTEADEAAAMRDERWQAVQVRAGEMGVTVGRCESVMTVELEREWEVCNRCVVVDSPDDRSWEGRECTLIDIDRDDEELTYCVRDNRDRTYWVHSIHRP